MRLIFAYSRCDEHLPVEALWTHAEEVNLFLLLCADVELCCAGEKTMQGVVVLLRR